MHGRDLEKQRCLSSNSSDDNHSPRWPKTLLPTRQRGQELGESGEGTGISEDRHQVWGHPPGTGSPRRWWLLPSPPQPVLGMLPTMQSLYCLLHSLVAPSLLLLGLLSPILLGSLSFISPFLTFLFSKSLPWTCLRGEKNTSSQLPALPLASCSSFMFDSNPTIYTAEPWAKPNVSGTCQKPQLFLSPINSFLPPFLHLLPVPF